MACLSGQTTNIEDIITNRDDSFHFVLENMDTYKSIVYELFHYYRENNNEIKFKSNFEKKISFLSKKYKIKVSKVYIVYVYQTMIKTNEIINESNFWLYIQKCPSRNLSGVNSFAILLSPFPNGIEGQSCNHNCYYCPDETRKNGADDDMPRSYLKREPAVQRGFRNNWSAIKQMNDRMNSLMVQGHEVDKLELIIEGGTYTEFPMDYLEKFHRDLFYSANVFFETSPKRYPKSLQDEIYINIFSKVRIIGICIETRPDAIDEKWIRFFRKSGTTRIQIGVQHTDNKILKKINRGHTFEDSCKAVKLLKDNCFKVDIHLMPDLPNSSFEKDKEMFDIIFKTNIICPDQVKIYPCEITPYTVIEKWYKSGKFIPYSEKDPESLNNVIKYGMEITPEWVRLPRVVRDIPKEYILSGNKISNLRQLIEKDINIKEIRSREIGRHPQYMNKKKHYCFRKYYHLDDIEYFISLESYDKKVIFGFIRLRIPVKDHNPYFECLKNKGLIRELHVYNHIIPVGKESNHSQHKGIGKQLLFYAEMISWFYGKTGTAVITGEGVRDYYHKRGYYSCETYVIKEWYSLYSILLLIIMFSFILCINYFTYKNIDTY